MDHILCDSELAPQLFKLIDDKLQETRKALEDTRNEKDAIQAELLRLQAVQATAGSEGSAQEDLKNTRKMLTNELEMNQRLQGENADLRGLLEGCRTAETEGTSRQDAMDASAGCPGTGCEVRTGSVRT
ncbi:uncharacterized protein PHACADRAFT_113020 [Phanerochaete carnosa HHB-10118-sp]|uniref:Uncharacterized protein n=1 Tax=Phanerochaete carnosa (strain HHB-10118-sp) TaxID=650164 RepID=K5W4V1_PHACS|nr:uncharacterized protein PHACADRAFT_113020 [Phanerochaete carnosa HHB-10118-sp]EKM58918.1 hypothetical protein PHACADRAFT_113020 [Phanerochaete carnosa HHB-10118-sp]